MLNTQTAIILGVLAGLVCTILLYVKILPKKVDGTLGNKFWQWVHNFFRFKKLYIEEVLRFFYVLATVVCICVGVFLLLGYREIYAGFNYNTQTVYYDRESTVVAGLLLMILGPIALRLVFEEYH